MSANLELIILSYSGPSGIRHTRSMVAGPGLGEPVAQPVVVAEHPGIFLAERHDDGAGQRRQIDHEVRLVLGVDVVQHVGQHEAALGVGVDDLDGLAVHRLDDVARALGVAVRHVLDEADGADRVDLGLARGERVHQADDAGRARHVAFHVLHAGGGLDRDAAGVEGHALADEGDRRHRPSCRRSSA